MAKESSSSARVAPRQPQLTAEEQFAVARQTISDAKGKKNLRLSFAHLTKLNRLPAEIEKLKSLKSLDINSTKISDLTPIGGLTSLEKLSFERTKITKLDALVKLKALEEIYLSRTRVTDLTPLSYLPSLGTVALDYSRVQDIAPLAKLPNLKNLSLKGAQLKDFAPLTEMQSLETLSLEATEFNDPSLLAELTSLEGLSLNSTPVEDISALASLRKLKRLRLSNTRVRNLAPISELSSLEGLSIENTSISDLNPIAQLTNLPDAALAGETMFGGGLFFKGSESTKKAPFDRLSSLRQPRQTIATINELRRRIGLREYFPTRPKSSENDENERGQLTQRPASHSFLFHENRLVAESQSFAARHPDVAADIRSELASKTEESAARLATCNAPRRLLSTVNRLQAALGGSLEEIRAGILQMRFRTLEADVAAYDTEEGRRELPEDALAMLRDLASSVEDLMGCFPQLADIEAERLAQRLKETDVPKIMEALWQIRSVAETNDAVDSSAVEALKEGEPELEHDTEIIESGASDAARTAAVNARDRTVGYMLLVYRNFVASAVRAGTEVAGLGADTWRGVRKNAPEQLSSAGIALVVAGLVSALLGPTAAVGAFALSFKPLRDRARSVSNKLTSLVKKSQGTFDDESNDDQSGRRA